MSNTYREMKDRQQRDVDAFPMMFAFNQEQFNEGMERLGLKSHETDKLYRMSNTGGFYRKTDAPALREMFERFNEEMTQAIADDKTGNAFIFDMFRSELANHEYSYTQDLTDALEALGITEDQIEADPRLQHGLDKAIAFELGEEIEQPERSIDDLIQEAHEKASRHIPLNRDAPFAPER